MARRHISKIPESGEPAPEGSAWQALRGLLPYLKDFPGRVTFALTCLALAKGAGVVLPLILKHIVDGLQGGPDALVVVPEELLDPLEYHGGRGRPHAHPPGSPPARVRSGGVAARPGASRPSARPGRA